MYHFSGNLGYEADYFHFQFPIKKQSDKRIKANEEVCFVGDLKRDVQNELP